MAATEFIQNTIDELSKLSRLDITTIVGDFAFIYKNDKGLIVDKDSPDPKKPDIIDISSGKYQMTSQINLITGDITTAMNEKFVTDYKDLRDYHMIRENQGHEIINRNLKVLQQISATLVLLVQNKDKTPDTVEK
ncbi:MAG: hypothetical protein WC384_07545 [Prolixibacteraceae bacterium]|jgi:hypothetical protein